MITTEDMALIISRDLQGFGMVTYVKDHIPIGNVEKDGRIVILPKTDDIGTYFDRCFVEVNFVLPDVREEPDIRLDDIERDAYRLFKDYKAGEYNGQWYNITYSRRSRERDAQMKTSYVHFQLLFETLNTL